MRCNDSDSAIAPTRATTTAIAAYARQPHNRRTLSLSRQCFQCPTLMV